VAIMAPPSLPSGLTAAESNRSNHNARSSIVGLSCRCRPRLLPMVSGIKTLFHFTPITQELHEARSLSFAAARARLLSAKTQGQSPGPLRGRSAARLATMS
jgi:hypothetical protein